MDFKNATNEWIAIKTQLAAARKDLSTLNQREKELRKFVTKHMGEHNIDTVNVQDKVKVNFKMPLTDIIDDSKRCINSILNFLHKLHSKRVRIISYNLNVVINHSAMF